MRGFITRPMLQRSLATAVIVGGILFTINHDMAVLRQSWTSVHWRQLGMSMVIPFVVSLTSSVLTLREFCGARGTASGT